MTELSRRALHFVFKIGNRRSNVNFFINILGMKVLRHEEFEEGCDAACNGPYDGKWSKTMVGYGCEDDHFVIELTYNYGIREYQRGNDFKSITIESPSVFERFRMCNYIQRTQEDGSILTRSPDGYPFVIVNKESTTKDPVVKLSLLSSNIARSTTYWADKLKMSILQKNDEHVVLSYKPNEQTSLEFVTDKDTKVDHALAYGRVAFSCPRSQLPELEKMMKDSGETILKPLIALDTPGKATVEVVILGDPDGHEICFVGDEAFRELSQIDPKADELLKAAMDNDKSDEWHAKKRVTSS